MKLFSAENVCSCSEKYRTDEKRIETCMKIHSWNLSIEYKENVYVPAKNQFFFISEYPSKGAVP